MGRAKTGWYEREQIKRVDMDWVVTNCRITDREFELLEIINDRKLVRRDMLEVISPSYRYLGDNRTRIMNRSINKLFKSMVLDKVHEPQRFMEGNTPAIVALDRAGSLILGVPHKQRIKYIKNITGGSEYIRRELPSNFQHINGINQIEVDTISFCEDTGSELIEWVHEKPVELYYGQDKVSLIPDISMKLKLVRNDSDAFCAFIEFDTGTESIRYREPPIIRDKIIKYRKYMLSKLWENEYPKFPFLLLVTQDEKRIDFFNKKCRENGVAGLGVYYKNYKKFLYKLSNII